MVNKVILMGRLTREPEIWYSQGDSNTCIARYTLAVDRRFCREGEQNVDFIPCVAFGKSGEFAEKYLHKGTKIMVTGRITTGSFTNKEGRKVYTTDITVEEQEFCESKAASAGADVSGSYRGQQSQQPQQNKSQGQPQQESRTKVEGDDLVEVPEDIADQLPFV